MKTKDNAVKFQLYTQQDVIQIGARVCNLWKVTAQIWSIIYFFVTIGAFSTSLFVVLCEYYGMNNSSLIMTLAAVASILTFMAFAINFKQQIPKYRQAFVGINAAMLEYYANPNDVSKRDAIVKAIIKGEKIINQTYEL